MANAISQDQLEPSDVLLSFGLGSVSTCIRMVDGGSYSHGGLWIGNGTLVEATLARGVAELTLEESLSVHPRQYMDVYRHRSGQGKLGDVAARGRHYLGHFYSKGDLELCALLLITASFLPKTKWQVAYLIKACQIEQFFGFDKPKEGERVTCTEIVARAFLEADVAIRVRPEAGHRVDAALVWAAVKEIAKESHKKGFEPEPPPGEAEAGQVLELLRRKYVEVMGVDPVAAHAEMRRESRGEPPLLTAGGLWNANLVTPHNLEASPDLELKGRLYAAPSR